jgi:hypothetical protein
MIILILFNKYFLMKKKGFGGIGGFLRYKFEVEHLNAGVDVPEDDDDFI